MFEGMQMGRPAGEAGRPAVPSATQGVRASAPAVEQSSLPRLWQETAPGPEMIAALADLSLQSCSDHELLDVLAGWQRVEAWISAQQTRALERTRARLFETAVREETDIDGHTSWTAVHRQVETEISTALCWTSRFTAQRLDTAATLTDRLPDVVDALAAGQLSYRHAEMICDETATLTEQQARRVVDRLLPEASSKTVGGLRRQLRKACLQIDPETSNERANKAIGERSVTIRPLSDGLAQLEAIGPAEAILAMFRTLNETAGRPTKDDQRTKTARRFDALVDFVLTAWSPAGAGADTADCPPLPKIPTLAQITMDLPTVLGLRDNPAEMPGYGPLPANLARALAADADWQRFIQDPVTGAPLDLGRTRRHPDADLRRWITARDRTCLFPECYRPAADCEPDHNPAWEHGGGSNKDTLHQLCPKHHKVRHHGWHYERHPDRLTWTSPHGRIYQRYFVEADLIDPDAVCPDVDDAYDDFVDLPINEDQRLHIFLPKNRSDRPADLDEEIPWEIVEAFGLEDSDTCPVEAFGELLDEVVLTPEQEQVLIDQDHFRRYGSTEPPPPENPEYHNVLNRRRIQRARRRQAARQPLPDEPPF